MQHIKDIYTENTGGGVLIDFVVLNNGNLIGIGEGLICLYQSIDDFFNGEALNTVEVEGI